MAERIHFAHLQRTAMLAADRQALALEEIAATLKTIAVGMGLMKPEEPEKPQTDMFDDVKDDKEDNSEAKKLSGKSHAKSTA